MKCKVRLSMLKLNSKTIEDKHTLQVYPKRDLIIESGKGIYLYDIDHKQYSDCVAGWGSINVGHSNPQINNSIKTR